MSFGAATVELVHLEPTGTPDELGNYTLDEVVTRAAGCHHRPLTFKESVELAIDIGTQPWKTTLPIREYSNSLLAKLIALKPDDVIRVNGQGYQIMGGVRPHNDLEGRPFKATIISQKQIG